jgi:PAS domain S-box-containing protein
MAVLWAANLPDSYESSYLLMTLNLVFSTCGSGFVAYLIGRSYLIRGTPGLLMLGCGVIFWGVAGVVGIATGLVGLTAGHFDINVFVTIHNICVWLSALCHLAGAILSLRPRRAVGEASLWLAGANAAALGCAGMVTLSALTGWTPAFFVQGQGGTPLRHLILASATAMFALSALLLKKGGRRPLSAFLYWYTLALGLIAIGLFGIMIESVHAGPLSWTGRAAQFLGGAYMLIAAIASVHETHSWRIPLENSLRKSEERYRNLFNNMTEGFALHEIVCDGKGRPCDYRFLDINPAFERLTGLTREDVVGKLVSAVLPDNDPFWVETYGEVALTGKPVHFENYFSPLKRHYEVYAYRPAPDQFAVTFTDITERKRAEETLQRSETLLRAITDNSPDPIFLKDRDCRMMLANPATLAIIGKAAEEVIGRTDEEFYDDPATGQVINANDRRIMGSGRMEVVEEIVLGPSGPVTYLSTKVPYRDAKGQVIGLIGVARDITNRKRAEEAMRASEERLRLVLQASSLGTFEVDLLTGKGRWNALEFELLGLKPGDAPSDPETFFRFVHPEDVGPLQAQWQEALRLGNLDAEFRIVRADGEVRWLAGKGQFTFGGMDTPETRGHAVRFMGVNFDITARKQAEEALRASEERLRYALESCQIGAWDIDLVDHTAFRSVEHDRIFGYAELLPAWTYEIFIEHVLPEDRAMVDAKFQRAMKSQGDWNFECRIRRTDGNVRWIWAAGRHRQDDTGAPRRMAGIVQDITERKQAEEALLQAKVAAEAASVAKSQFLTNMSHELRTPMNAILGMIDIALPKAIDPTVQDCLQTVKGSADLLLTLLNDLLDSAKIESGKLELESAPFSLRQMLDQMTRVLAVRASENGLGFYCRLPEETPDALIGDRMRLQQVLLNLAGNAIKFTERGEVEVSVRAVPRDDEACLEFVVRDTGIGIPPALLERLFQPFGQADASMSRRFGGTGLGLSICKNLLDLMGGRIWVESQVGKGSTFYFTVQLSLAKELPPDVEARVAIPAAARVQLRILLAEDNPANQKLATYLLEDRGHLVEIAGNGQEAVSLTEQNSYDVILMDVQMPEMNGLEATAAIRRREDGSRRVPIIAMTAHAMKGDRERCLAAGMDDYLSKPIDAHETIALVERVAAVAAAANADAVPTTPGPAEAATPPTSAVFDPELALTRCLNEPDLLRQMIAYFFKDADTCLPQMRVALQKGDLAEVGRLGHRLKGTLGHIAAEAARDAAERVERFLLHAGEQAEAEAAVRTFERKCEVLRAALTEYQATTNSMSGGQ